MGGIIDLTDGSDHEVLTSTESTGLLGGQYLAGEPLATYLEDDEEPKYVLRNKKSGLEIKDGEESQTIEPGGDYQTLALVTDLRLLFVAGQRDGDISQSLALMDIVEARVESGLRTSTLTVETLSNQTWTFPCRGNPSPAATYIEEAAQIWANAARLLDELEESLGLAQDDLTAGGYESAHARIEGGEATMEAAIDRAAEVGEQARSQIADRASKLREWLIDVQREVTATEGAHKHAGAQDHWQTGEYEKAAQAYEQALEAYKAALDIDGATPEDGSLQARLRGVVAERELLRVGPLVDADTKRRRAVALADPEDAATEWEAAHEGYRELLGLEWAQSNRQFVADRELIREQTVEIADDAISDHHEAGRRWLTAGDKLAVQDRKRQAEQVYERAKKQFEKANRLASELRPERVDEIEAGTDAATLRLDGQTPTETVPEDPLTFEPKTLASEDDQDGEADEESEESPDDDIEGLSFHDSEPESSQTTPIGQSAGSTDQTQTTTTSRPVSTDSSTSVLEQIQAQKQTELQSSTADQETANDGDESDGESDTSSDETAAATKEFTDKKSDSAESDGEPAETDGTSEERDSDPVSTETLAQSLAQLDEKRLIELVSDLWEANGWRTTIFGTATETVYDIVAIRAESDERTLIWVEHENEVAKTTIKQCVTTLESSQGENAAILVTTGSVTSAAQTHADKKGVTVVDSEQLLADVQSVGLATQLASMAEK